MLQVRLLGQFLVQVENKPVVIPARAAQSLFAFLILSPGVAHRREKLAGMLWPDMSDDGARRNLRHELWRLRKALGANRGDEAVAVRPMRGSVPAEYILSEELAIRFNPDAEFWLDVAQLERATAPDDTVGDWIGCVALYRGELLPGFYDDWVGPERDRVQALYETRMDELVRRLLREERWLTAIEWAERWIALGHTPEAAYRALMLAHSAQGETSKIALDYERCAEALRADLDIDPSNDTRALYEKLTRGEIASPAQMETSPAIFVQSSGTVTFLFSDIEGSTKLLDKLGPDYAKLLAEHQDLIRSIAERYNGHEVDTQGDSFFFAFFRAADAVAFAAESQRALAAHKFPQDTNVRVRMGLHTGEPMLARTGYVGMDVHRAARIGAAGHGGQVLLSPSTRALVENELPGGTTLRDLGEYKLKDLRYPVHIVQLTIDGLPADFPPLKSINTGSEPPAPGEPPFKGLEFFDEGDANLFFGREQLIEKLASQVSNHRFLAVVVGASGSGKSSVVRAGLIPALRRDVPVERYDWKIFVMTPTAHPLEALATVLTRDDSLTVTAQLMDDLAREPRSLHLFIRRMTMDEKLQDDPRPSSSVVRRFLVVVDQFEELFTLCHDDLEREQFIDNLVNALGQAHGIAHTSPVHPFTSSPPHSLTLILTIRADFYAHLAEYPELRDLVAKQQEYIGPMNTDELRRAIEEPAKQNHWEFEPGLVDLILRDVGDEPGALPLLSHALLETWKRRNGHLMTLKGYHDAGGVRGAIAHTAESTYQQLSPEQQNIARNIFVRLTELGEGTEDTRRRAEIGELETGDAKPQDVRQVLTLLADARLITTGEHTAEVAHEALIREWHRLREWLNQDREGLKLHRNLTEAATEWKLMERDASVLYRGSRLAQAQEFAATNPNALNAHERGFMEASEENEKREAREREEQNERELLAAQKLAAEQQARIEETNRANKRLRQRAIFLAGVVVLALIAAGAALYFLTQSNGNLQIANEQHAEADLQRDNALKAEAQAEKEKRAATARELASASVANLDIDPERSILLALQAVDATKKDGTVLREAEEALHRAVGTSRIVQTLAIPNRRPREIAYTPDGKFLATNANDGAIRLWDVKSGSQIRSIPIKEKWLDHLYFSPDGTKLATVDVQGDNTIAPEILDVQTGRVLHTITVPIEPKAWTYSAYSPDWKRVAIGIKDGTIHVFDMENGKELLKLEGHTDVVEDVAYGPDGTRIATVSDDKSVKIWDAETGKELQSLKGHSSRVLTVAFSHQGKLVATGGQDHDAKIWDAQTGALLQTVPGGAGDWVTRVEFTPDDKQLATLSLNHKAMIWDVATGNELLRLLGQTGFSWGMAVNPAESQLATGSDDGTVRLWDIGLRGEIVTVPTTGILSTSVYLGNITMNPAGTLMAVGLNDGTVKVWDANDGHDVFTLRGHTDSVRVAFSRDGKWLGSASSDNTAKIWDTQTGKEKFTFSGHNKPVGMIAFHPDGERVATGDEDGIIKIWNMNTGGELQTFNLSSLEISGLVFGLDFSPDGTQLAASTDTGFATVLNIRTGKPNFKFQESNQGVFNIVFNPEGTQVALSTPAPPGATILDAKTGQKISTIGSAPIGTDWVEYSRDGKYLASAHLGDGVVRVWDTATGNELLTLSANGDPPFAATFSPDATRLATVSDQTVRVYYLKIEDLLALAKTRVTRSLTQEECQKYLHVDECPE